MDMKLRQRLASLSKVSVYSTLVVTVAILIVIWAITLERVRHERENAIAAEVQRDSNLAESHKERATRSFELLDQVLLFFRTEYLVHGLPKSVKDRLRSFQVNDKYIAIVSVIGPQGQLLSTTGDFRLENYADRDYFKAHAENASDQLLISKPILGRLTGKWVVALTRRITLADGSFGGVVFLALDPTYFATDYANTDRGQGSAMALIGLDGITRARRNGDKISFGEDVSASQLFKELPKAANGHYIGVAASDGYRRIVAYRSTEGYPMVTIVASSLEDVLAKSREREFVYLAGAAGTTLVVLVLVLSYFISTSRQTQNLAAVADSERRYRLLFENSLDAVISAKPDGRIASANAAACRMFGFDSEQLQNKYRSELFASDDSRLGKLIYQEKSEGTMQGSVSMLRSDGSRFEAEVSANLYPDGSQLSSMIIRDVSDRKVAEDQIKTLAFYDALTLLPNRRLLMDRLQLAVAACARHQRKGALLFIDLDNFKILNDTLGHFRGDVLLQEVAKRLNTCIREGDTCARLGGDEFVVMLEDLSEVQLEAAKQAEVVGEKILLTLSQTYQLDFETTYDITPSIGLTLFDAELDGGIDEPLKRADLAMYQAKSAGRNTQRFFDPQIQAAIAGRAALEVSLRAALKNQEFLLHYQPQIQGENHVTGGEVLVRWRHPERGMVSPAEFIPLAEETGLILPLGQWVLETACIQLARWAGQTGFSDLTLSVNVSERQFRQEQFVEHVIATLQRTGAPANRLKLELTEGLLVTNIEDIIGKMLALKQQGVGFSLDDFGTGYSSLSYLKRLPLDELKIDQGFVRDILVDPNDAAIAKMVILLADSLGLSVVAEGVETEAQRLFLQTQGCHDYQGYLFSRPVALEDFEGFFRQMS
jgi:diguanylate cyclase (GGDEF)-like protein/PAS domain S-box-containing protein